MLCWAFNSRRGNLLTEICCQDERHITLRTCQRQWRGLFSTWRCLQRVWHHEEDVILKRDSLLFFAVAFDPWSTCCHNLCPVSLECRVFWKIRDLKVFLWVEEGRGKGSARIIRGQMELFRFLKEGWRRLLHLWVFFIALKCLIFAEPRKIAWLDVSSVAT